MANLFNSLIKIFQLSAQYHLPITFPARKTTKKRLSQVKKPLKIYPLPKFMMPSRENLTVKLPGCLAAPPRASVLRSPTEVSKTRGCSQLLQIYPLPKFMMPSRENLTLKLPKCLAAPPRASICLCVYLSIYLLSLYLPRFGHRGRHYLSVCLCLRFTPNA